MGSSLRHCRPQTFCIACKGDRSPFSFAFNCLEIINSLVRWLQARDGC